MPTRAAPRLTAEILGGEQRVQGLGATLFKEGVMKKEGAADKRFPPSLGTGSGILFKEPPSHSTRGLHVRAAHE